MSHLLSKNLREDEIDEEIEKFRQERLAKAEEEAIDVSKWTCFNPLHAWGVPMHPLLCCNRLGHITYLHTYVDT